MNIETLREFKMFIALLCVVENEQLLLMADIQS